MNINYFGMCSWTFDKKSEYNIDTFSLLDKEQKEKVIEERLHFLSEVLNVLETETILLVNRLETNIDGIDNEYFFDKPDISNIIDKFKSDILSQQDKQIFSCTAEGFTVINTSNGEKAIEKIIDLFYGFNGNYIYIRTYTDLWSPMDLEDNYQIDLAVLNNPRLKRCLQKIKALGGYSFICPDEGEFGDDELSQFGFTVIPYQGDITKRKDFPKGREEEVKPFLWKYIQ